MQKKEINQKREIDILSSFKSIDADNMKVFGVVGSDDSVDRYGDRINPKGWDLENFKKNPVIMLNHDYHQFPIGKAINVRRKDNALVFDIQFSKTLELAKQAFGLVKEGIMKAWSVGFLVKEWAKSGGEYTIDKMELLELSLVAIPANPNALLNNLDDNQRKMVKSFDLLLKSLENEPKQEEKAENDASDEVAPLEETEKNNEEAVETNEPKGDEKNEKESAKEEKPVEENEGKDTSNEGETKSKEEIDEVIEEKIFEKIVQSDRLKNLIEAEVQKGIEAKLGSQIKAIQSDEDKANDPQLQLLTAISKELKVTDKGAGKALKALNELLSNIKKE